MIFANWEDFREGARRRLPKVFFEYIDGAAFSEATARANIEDFDAWKLEQRALVDIAKRDLTTSYLGKARPLPFMLGPVGFAGLFAPRGEILAARAAHAAGLPFCLSHFGIASIEALRAATDGPLWQQIYMMKDGAVTERLIRRAAEAECEALALTVDTPLGGIRERDVRNGFRSARRITPKLAWSMLKKPRWCFEIGMTAPVRIGNLDGHPEYGANAVEQAGKLALSPSLTWDDAKRIRDGWNGKFVLKGILHPDDARRAAEIGADAIVVSNHGGRQLDHASSTIAALPEIVAAAGGRLDVLLDGGIRRGAQVVKALALGAKGVLLGRAYAYALGAAGGAGVAQLIDMLRLEASLTLGHMGQTRIDALHGKKDLVLRRR